MITIKSRESNYCNTCARGKGVVEIALSYENSGNSYNFVLCTQCLSKLSDVAKQAQIAIQLKNKKHANNE